MSSKDAADRRCREIAGERHNVLARDEAIVAGHDHASIRRRINSGKWQEISRRALYLGTEPPGWLELLAAATVSVGGAAFRRSAAALHRFPGIPRREIEVVTTGKAASLAGVSTHHTKYLPDEDVTLVDGICVTSPARTLLDMCGLLDVRRARSLMLALIDAGVLTASELWDVLERTTARGRPGSAGYRTLAQYLASEGQLPASDLEDQAYEVIVRNGFPEPARQHEFIRAGVFLGRADLAYPPFVGIEVDGWDWHRTKLRFLDDRSRQNGLISHGILILRFTARDAERPLRFLADLKRTLALARSLETGDVGGAA